MCPCHAGHLPQRERDLGCSGDISDSCSQTVWGNAHGNQWKIPPRQNDGHLCCHPGESDHWEVTIYVDTVMHIFAGDVLWSLVNPASVQGNPDLVWRGSTSEDPKWPWFGSREKEWESFLIALKYKYRASPHRVTYQQCFLLTSELRWIWSRVLSKRRNSEVSQECREKRKSSEGKGRKGAAASSTCGGQQEEQEHPMLHKSRTQRQIYPPS